MTVTQIIRLAQPWRGRLIGVAVLMLIESMVLLVVPWAAGQLAADLVAGSQRGPVGLAVLLLALLLFIAVLRATVGLLSGTTATRMLAALRTHVHDHLQALPVPFHENQKQGDILALTTWEIGRLSDFLTTTLVSLPPLVLTAAGAVVLMFRIDPVLSLIVPVLVPVFYLALKVLGRRLRHLAVLEQEADAATMAIAEEHLGMLPAIKSFTREGPASRRYGEAVGQARDISLRQVRILAVLDPLIGFIAAAAAVVLLLLAGQGLQAGTMTTSDLFAFLLYAALLTRPVATLASVYGQIQSLRGTLERLGRILDTAPEPAPDQGLPLERAKGMVEFAGVGFSYPGRSQTLADISLMIPAGQTLALTGPNGAGKSTLMAVLLRFRLPDAGVVRLDGVDVQALRLRDLRRQIGVVPQRPLLFNGTIADNIGFGRDGATTGDIVAAARFAQADDFITGLPEGYGTVIGDHGVRLSGGQGQRIALARALIKDPPILVLDEATSMFDTDGEAGFVAAALAALQDRTVIIITHRPATLALADRIIRLDHGRIVADDLAA